MILREGDPEVQRWRLAPRRRPEHIAPPGPGQESVWDYPRPPRLEPYRGAVRVEFGGVVVASSECAWRVLETANPPTFYLPAQDVRSELLHRAPETPLCEWKGVARTWSLRAGGRESRNAAWSYPDPFSGFERIRGFFAFFVGRADGCFLDGRGVTPQAGGYYGGWITPEVIGPFKGEPGSEDW